MEKKFLIMAIDPRSKAFHEYNIQAGDIIQEVNGEQVTSLEQLAHAMEKEHVVMETESGIHFFKNWRHFRWIIIAQHIRWYRKAIDLKSYCILWYIFY